jgi:hypothetical protein
MELLTARRLSAVILFRPPAELSRRAQSTSKAMGMTGIPKSQVNRLCGEIDGRLTYEQRQVDLGEFGGRNEGGLTRAEALAGALHLRRAPAQPWT